MKSSLLDPIIIVQLGNLHIRARRILDGLYSGYHNTPFRGSSQEFSEHRSYNPGDDPKTLDWKALGRTDRLVVKQFEEETNVAGWILLDDSASMQFAYDGRPSKLEYAKTLAAALGYLLTFQHDAVGLAARDILMRPEAGRGHLEQFISVLSGVQPSGVWDIGRLIKQINVAHHRRTFVFIFSDMMGDERSLMHSVKFLMGRKNEVVIFQILDPAEIDLPMNGQFIFKDAETDTGIRIDTEAIREKYRMVVKSHLDSFSVMCRKQGVDYCQLTTNTSFDKGLGAYLSRRSSHP